jgi:hypothetical protein
MLARVTPFWLFHTTSTPAAGNLFWRAGQARLNRSIMPIFIRVSPAVFAIFCVLKIKYKKTQRGISLFVFSF